MIPQLNINPTTAAQIRDYLINLTSCKKEIKYPELEIEKLDNGQSLYHISSDGKRRLSLSEDNYKIYQEL